MERAGRSTSRKTSQSRKMGACGQLSCVHLVFLPMCGGLHSDHTTGDYKEYQLGEVSAVFLF